MSTAAEHSIVADILTAKLVKFQKVYYPVLLFLIIIVAMVCCDVTDDLVCGVHIPKCCFYLWINKKRHIQR